MYIIFRPYIKIIKIHRIKLYYNLDIIFEKVNKTHILIFML